MSTFRTKFDYSKFKKYQPVHISTYLGNKEQVRSLIGSTYDILKVVSFGIKQLQKPKVKDRKSCKVYKSKGSVQLSVEDMKIVEGFLQVQNISAKHYLSKVTKGGSWELHNRTTFQRRVTDQEATRPRPTWGGRPFQPRGWRGPFPKKWPLHWGG